MIKKISQLNPLPISAYGLGYDEFWDETERRHYEEMLFEVSYQTEDDYDPKKADEIDYYTSYNLTLSGLDNALRLPGMREALSAILCGNISVITGDVTVGIPGDPVEDKVEHDYYPTNEDTTLKVYSKFDLENDSTIHGIAEFHNDANFLGYGAILSVQGEAHFDQLIHGVAFRAQWGDLAEFYSADSQYEPGTLVKFGGEKEITIATEKANAVVTSKPGIILNGADSIENPTCVALAGRVPIKVRGQVHKFDKIVLSRTDPGTGVVYNHAFEVDVIGRALEENLDKDEKLVMCATRFNIG